MNYTQEGELEEVNVLAGTDIHVPRVITLEDDDDDVP